GNAGAAESAGCRIVPIGLERAPSLPKPRHVAAPQRNAVTEQARHMKEAGWRVEMGTGGRPAIRDDIVPPGKSSNATG
ncbi:hypothetical protein M3665_26705, partial [Bacillus licheniformis]|nr:hypothetical protein [Bacillus licheniformis]